MSTVFVTGGSGFVGRHLIVALLERGDSVRALARSDVAAATVETLGAMVVRGDINHDDALRNGMAGADVVFHAAALVAEWGSLDDFHRINVTGTKQTLNAAQDARVSRFVHISTEAVIADGRPIIDADESRPHAVTPAGLYPMTKSLAEKAVIAANTDTLATIVVRPRLIWGKGDTSLLPQLVEAVNTGRFRWISGGRYQTSTCHIANVVEGSLLAAEHGKGGEVYFLTDGDPVEFRWFMTELLGTQGITPGKRSVPRPVAHMVAHIGEYIWNILNLSKPPPVTRMAVALIGSPVTVIDAKARRELGYKSTMTIEAGLNAMRETN